MNSGSIDSAAARLTPGYIASPDEASDIVSSVQFLLADNIRFSLSNQLTVGESLIAKILSVSDLLSRVKQSSSGVFSPVTPEKLMNSGRSTDDLLTLFLNDGPRLGVSVSDGQSILDDLNGLGADVEVKVLYPFLTELKDSDGKLTSSKFEWLTQSQVEAILDEKLTSTESGYPGAVAFSKKVDSSLVTYTNFESYGILRPELSSINTAFSRIGEIVDGYRDELLSLIANTSRAATQLDSMIDRIFEAGKVQEIRKNENSEKTKADLIELLRRINLLKIEKFTKDDLIVDPEISTKASENSANPDK